MVGKHRNTLEAVFADPLRSNVLWADVLWADVEGQLAAAAAARAGKSINGFVADALERVA